jgi:hypothetical protein
MSEKSRDWINRHESWWNESINKEIAFHDLERILDDYERELRLSNVVWRSEQLVCDCGKPYHEKDLEHGMCHKCWEPTKEAN